ncbi:conserved hypothetical protein [Rhodopirellula baltica SH 1]|uniref:Putative restriction endonuclease domain-containing protein n=2 Tax=Rhodopirellula baltica TaxID=265606 RepID=Q7UFN5_RHOBA|nr:conserved hypothetical protein [Rhodopirellula baltica SH 1]
MPAIPRVSKLRSAMSTNPIPLLSEQEYLDQERKASFKSEYFGGETFAMGGAKRAHNLIVTNLIRVLSNALLDGPCEVYPCDMRVQIEATGLYTYPDVVVACDEPKFRDDQLDTLQNPTLLIEVASESTEAYDRGTKSRHYRRIPSLKGYVLVAQDRPAVESFTRGDDHTWTLREAGGLENELRIDALKLNLSMTEVYHRVQFDRPDPLVK